MVATWESRLPPTSRNAFTTGYAAVSGTSSGGARAIVPSEELAEIKSELTLNDARFDAQRWRSSLSYAYLDRRLCCSSFGPARPGCHTRSSATATNKWSTTSKCKTPTRRPDALRNTRPEPTAPPERDPLEDLKELAELHRSGFLTDDEFVTAKAKVLSSGDDEPA